MTTGTKSVLRNDEAMNFQTKKMFQKLLHRANESRAGWTFNARQSGTFKCTLPDGHYRSWYKDSGKCTKNFRKHEIYNYIFKLLNKNWKYRTVERIVGDERHGAVVSNK